MSYDRIHPEHALLTAWRLEQWKDVDVLVAVSGGADSVALLRAILAVRGVGTGRTEIAHCNHGWRGPASDSDEAFVQDLAKQWNLGFHCERCLSEPGEGASGESIEGKARRLRYEFFRHTAERVGARHVVTAHSADDQAETVLHRILRGTGIKGLSGIPFVRRLGPAVTVVRPFLEVTRGDVLRYLQELNQPYRTDESNENTKFTRNRIRHELMPHLQRQYNPKVSYSLRRLAKQASEVQQMVHDAVEQLAENCCELKGSDPPKIRMDCRQLRSQPRYLLRELCAHLWRLHKFPLRAMGFAEWDKLAELISTPVAALPASRISLPGNVTARRERENLFLERATGSPDAKVP